MQTRSGKVYTIQPSNIISNERDASYYDGRDAFYDDLSKLIGKPISGKTLRVEDLRFIMRYSFGKMATEGQPIKISNQLAKFIGKPVGSKITRGEAATCILRYIDSNNLLDVNGETINPDRKLTTLILPKNDKLTYFNIVQRIKHHFV
jgi:chromatin remodeling complex protein RSC6